MFTVYLFSSSSSVELRARSMIWFAPVIFLIIDLLEASSNAEADTISIISESGSLRFSPTLAKNVVLACSASSAVIWALLVDSNRIELRSALDTALLICSQTEPLKRAGFIRR